MTSRTTLTDVGETGNGSAANAETPTAVPDGPTTTAIGPQSPALHRRLVDWFEAIDGVRQAIVTQTAPARNGPPEVAIVPSESVHGTDGAGRHEQSPTESGADESPVRSRDILLKTVRRRAGSLPLPGVAPVVTPTDDDVVLGGARSGALFGPENGILASVTVYWHPLAAKVATALEEHTDVQEFDIAWTPEESLLAPEPALVPWEDAASLIVTATLDPTVSQAVVDDVEQALREGVVAGCPGDYRAVVERSAGRGLDVLRDPGNGESDDTTDSAGTQPTLTQMVADRMDGPDERNAGEGLSATSPGPDGTHDDSMRAPLCSDDRTGTPIPELTFEVGFAGRGSRPDNQSRVYRADGRQFAEVLNRAPRQSDRLQLTVTSPPYVDAVDYDAHLRGQFRTERASEDELPDNSRRDDEARPDWGTTPMDDEALAGWKALQKDIFESVFAATRPGGFCAVVIGHIKRDDGQWCPLPHHFAGVMEKAGWTFHERIIWDKVTGGGRFGTTIQHPYPGRYYPNQLHEEIQIWRKGPIRYPDDPESRLEMTDLMKKEIANNVWHVPPVPPNANVNHPCPFPEEIVHRLTLLYSNRGDLVGDPMAGSGTTPTVADRLGRVGVGVEKRPAYVLGGRTRLATERYERRDQLVPQYETDSVVRDESALTEGTPPANSPPAAPNSEESISHQSPTDEGSEQRGQLEQQQLPSTQLERDTKR